MWPSPANFQTIKRRKKSTQSGGKKEHYPCDRKERFTSMSERTALFRAKEKKRGRGKQSCRDEKNEGEKRSLRETGTIKGKKKELGKVVIRSKRRTMRRSQKIKLKPMTLTTFLEVRRRVLVQTITRRKAPTQGGSS